MISKEKLKDRTRFAQAEKIEGRGEIEKKNRFFSEINRFKACRESGYVIQMQT